MIPSSDATAQLEYRLNDFRKAYDNGTNLLIIYYGGHGCLDKTSSKPSRSVWQARRRGGASLVWSDLQGIMERAKCDVVFILDCCYAATASRSTGSKEGLWACNSEVTTTGVNDNSFTRNLIDELKLLKTSRFNIAMLHARLMGRYRKPGTHMLLTEPWYSYLGDVASPSAELTPQLPSQENSTDHTICIDARMTETVVLLAVRLKETERIPKVSLWKDWIQQNAPHDVNSVHALGRLQARDLVRLEAHFLSNSALLLVSMPIFLWDRLPHHAGYSFVGFIKSANSLLPSWNPQVETFFNSPTTEEIWARVETIGSLSEPDFPGAGSNVIEEQTGTARVSESAKQGLWARTEEQFEHLSAVPRQNFLGETHPDSLESMASLASALWDQGRWSEAEAVQEKLAQRLSNLLGEEHPSTLTSMNNLALIYSSRGRWSMAVELLEKVMKMTRAKFGAEHISTLSAAAKLALSYQKMGRWEEAESQQIEVLRTRMKILGQEDPDTLSSMEDLMSTYRNLGRSALAVVSAVAPERTDTPPNASSSVPFRRDPHFVQRTELTNQIHAKLMAPAGRAALVGLGGVGKSQLAIQYAQELRQRSPQTWVLWIYASNAARFEQSVRDVADQLGIDGRGDSEADHMQLLRNWLRDERRGSWLMILDNTDEANVLLESSTTPGAAHSTRKRIDYIPSCNHGSIIITTRSKAEALRLVDETEIIQVMPMSKSEAEVLLVSKLGDSSTDDQRLVQALDYMPLAITQAAAYIRERSPRCSVRQYCEAIEQSRNSRTSLLRRHVPLPNRDIEARNSVIQTWQLSFETLYQARRSAAELLSLMSFCNRSAIPEVLLRADTGNASLSTDSSLFEDDIAALLDFSLVSSTADLRSWEMHRLIQDATQVWLLDHSMWNEVFNTFVDRLHASFPASSFENRSLCRTLFPHAIRAAEQEPVDTITQLKWALIMYNSAWYPSEQGDYVNALSMAELSMTVRLRQLGREHEMTLQSTAMVADIYRNQGRWKEAEELEVKVMEASSRTLGEEHPNALVVIAGLASTCWNLGRWKEAEELEVKVMEVSLRTLGEEHPNTLIVMAGLASTYRNQGRWREAEELEVKVMEVSLRTLGEEHPSTLSAIANLALTYHNQGRWKEAEALEVKVMEASSRTLGEEHPSTLSAIANLALTYHNQGRWKEAEELEVKVMEASSRTLGEEHPSTLSAISNLALTYQKQGRWKEAEELEVKVMEASLRTLGEEHPSTLSAIANLALTYHNQGRWKEAEELEVKVMEASLRTLGEEHPSTLSAMVNLASTYWNQGQWMEAEDLQMQAFEGYKKSFGPQHPHTVTVMSTLTEIRRTRQEHLSTMLL